MKLKKLFLGIVAGCGLCILPLIISACNFDWLETKHCPNTDYPYYCSSANKCCSYPYTDGHGTCYQTLEGCRASGYACETCHIED
ncbi:MAG: hypothetical protein PHC83_01580 [Bacteroidales bacterium]|nr:hypothetical protein [Bacteroidales bacterium]MDD4208771.1 hypothetical protein [Bacteroidales bacterium]